MQERWVEEEEGQQKMMIGKSLALNFSNHDEGKEAISCMKEIGKLWTRERQRLPLSWNCVS
jgi:hypothetical protein